MPLRRRFRRSVCLQLSAIQTKFLRQIRCQAPPRTATKPLCLVREAAAGEARANKVRDAKAKVGQQGGEGKEGKWCNKKGTQLCLPSRPRYQLDPTASMARACRTSCQRPHRELSAPAAGVEVEVVVMVASAEPTSPHLWCKLSPQMQLRTCVALGSVVHIEQHQMVCTRRGQRLFLPAPPRPPDLLWEETQWLLPHCWIFHHHQFHHHHHQCR